MALAIERLTEATAAEYAELVGRCPETLLYVSACYRDFLRRVLPTGEDLYLLARAEGRLCGALPAFVAPGPYGPVINSLPFYGSHGGAFAAPDAPDPAGVKRALLAALDAEARRREAVATVIVALPLAADDALYAPGSDPELQDDRIGQWTPLPAGLAGDAAEARLMAAFHGKTRNSLRKAQRSELAVGHAGDEETLRRLARLHQDNLTAIGGRAKPEAIFIAIRAAFAYDRDYRVYTAYRGEELAAALLVFFHHRTVEYFTPATREAFRPLQPLSRLILEEMKEGTARGCAWWNWGGTWRTQTDVYRFKSRWGTEDHPYRYFVRPGPGMAALRRRATPAELLAAYPYFYVVPFAGLARPEASAGDQP